MTHDRGRTCAPALNAFIAVLCLFAQDSFWILSLNPERRLFCS